MLSALHQYANAHMANKAVLTQRSQQSDTVAYAKKAENPLAKFGKQLTGVLRGEHLRWLRCADCHALPASRARYSMQDATSTFDICSY